jgi:hypothetical protein
MDDIRIGFATVGPLDDAAGGIVGVLASAGTDEDFRLRVQEALNASDFEFVDLADVETLRSYSERHGLSASFTELLVEALRTGEVAVGTAHTYAHEEHDETPAREALAVALANEELTQIERFGGRHPLTGFVVGVGDTWLLLHLVSGVDLDGWTAMPVADVSEAVPVDEETTFTPRALRLYDRFPRRLPDVALGATRALIASAQSLFPVITLHLERDDDICYIGHVEDVDDESVELRLLSPAAQWEELQRFPFGEISRVEFGTAYDLALAEVGDEAPSETG